MGVLLTSFKHPHTLCSIVITGLINVDLAGNGGVKAEVIQERRIHYDPSSLLGIQFFNNVFSLVLTVELPYSIISKILWFKGPGGER